MSGSLQVGVSFASASKGLSSETLGRIDEVIARYQMKRSALLPALWLAQKEQGFCSLEAQGQIAESDRDAVQRNQRHSSRYHERSRSV